MTGKFVTYAFKRYYKKSQFMNKSGKVGNRYIVRQVSSVSRH